jgi:Xaa-Pro aminopeptidase/Xaa-Pro dipeptidase
MKLKEVREQIDKENLDAFLFSSQANVFYLSRFRSTHAYAVVTPSDLFLLTDGRYYERAKKELKDWEVVLIEGSPVPFLKKFLRERGLRKVGFEAERVSYQLRRALRSTKIKWIPFNNFLKKIRAVKTAEEIDLMKEGVKKSDAIFRDLLGYIKPGLTELEIRAFIVRRIFEEGSTGESFPAIVAGGEGSAIPHWETSGRKVGMGPLLIDMGLLWRGYCTDFTRTLYLGNPDGEFKKVFSIVRDAHLFAIERVKAGVKLGEVDRTAREYIESRGFGKFFTHSTGHGIGVEIHEFPRVYYRGEDSGVVIEDGMVFTVEPGIYLPGKFGVRLENIVAVRRGSGEPLSGIDLSLITL